MANSKRSAEKESFWRLVLEEHRQSELTARAFCAREGISEASFYAWRRKINRRDAPQTDSSQRPPLVPVNVVDAGGQVLPGCGAATSSTLEVIMPSGFTLRFDEGIEPKRLHALLGAIVRCQGSVAPC